MGAWIEIYNIVDSIRYRKVALLVSTWIEISLFCKETIADGGCNDLYAFLALSIQVSLVSILTKIIPIVGFRRLEYFLGLGIS